jgi:uncharacterized protein YecE (DUF72 family)
MIPRYFIGTSGWHYNHWKGKFYPKDLSSKHWLKYYAQHFNTVEINASFYRLPQESTFTHWHEEVPPSFCYSLKASRLITHVKRLKDSGDPLQTFTERASHLDSNLGPILYQLPQNFYRDDDRLAKFLKMLDTNLRHVFEFRHDSWMNEDIFNLLKKHNTGFCIFDMPGFSSPEEVTADFAYVRFHGKDKIYSGCYSEPELDEWAYKIQQLSQGLKTVFIYFNNDAAGYAIDNAKTIGKKLAGTPKDFP